MWITARKYQYYHFVFFILQKSRCGSAAPAIPHSAMIVSLIGKWGNSLLTSARDLNAGGAASLCRWTLRPATSSRPERMERLRIRPRHATSSNRAVSRLGFTYLSSCPWRRLLFMTSSGRFRDTTPPGGCFSPGRRLFSSCPDAASGLMSAFCSSTWFISSFSFSKSHRTDSAPEINRLCYTLPWESGLRRF